MMLYRIKALPPEDTEKMKRTVVTRGGDYAGKVCKTIWMNLLLRCEIRELMEICSSVRIHSVRLYERQSQG